MSLLGLKLSTLRALAAEPKDLKPYQGSWVLGFWGFGFRVLGFRVLGFGF